MGNLKEKIAEYLPTMKAKLKAEPDKKKKRYMRIKIQELIKLRDQL